MRHKELRHRLSRRTSHRKATLRHLVRGLILNKSIRTTRSKAKAASRLIDRLIALGKKGDLASRRLAYSVLCDRGLVKTLFDEVAPLFKNRNSGFTRILLINSRHGDNAQMAILEFVERPKPPVKKRKEKREQQKEIEAKKEPTVEKETKEAEKLPPKTKEVPKETPKPQKGRLKKAFTDGLRKFFRRRGEKG